MVPKQVKHVSTFLNIFFSYFIEEEEEENEIQVGLIAH